MYLRLTPLLQIFRKYSCLFPYFIDFFFVALIECRTRGEDAIAWFWLAQQKLCYYLTAQKTIELEKKKQRRSKKKETMIKHFQRIQNLCEWQLIEANDNFYYHICKFFHFHENKAHTHIRLLKNEKILSL